MFASRGGLGNFVDITISDKSPAEAAVVMAADRRQEVAALHHTVLGHRRICQTAWASKRLVFEVKNLPNGKKDLKTVKSEAQNRRKKTVAAKKRVSTTIERNLLKANGSQPVICCPGSLLHILIEIRFFSGTVPLRMPPFPCGKITARWQMTV